MYMHFGQHPLFDEFHLPILSLSLVTCIYVDEFLDTHIRQYCNYGNMTSETFKQLETGYVTKKTFNEASF